MAIFSVYKKRCDFLGSLKKQGFFGVLYLSPAQINNNIIAIYWLMWDWGGVCQKRSDFFGNSEVGIFWGMKIWTSVRPPVPTVGVPGPEKLLGKKSHFPGTAGILWRIILGSRLGGRYAICFFQDWSVAVVVQENIPCLLVIDFVCPKGGVQISNISLISAILERTWAELGQWRQICTTVFA